MLYENQSVADANNPCIITLPLIKICDIFFGYIPRSGILYLESNEQIKLITTVEGDS